MSRVTIVKNLGFVSTPSLSCIFHIDTIFNKAMCILGFIRWSVTNFISLCLIASFGKLISSIIEYGFHKLKNKLNE